MLEATLTENAVGVELYGYANDFESLAETIHEIVMDTPTDRLLAGEAPGPIEAYFNSMGDAIRETGERADEESDQAGAFRVCLISFLALVQFLRLRSDDAMYSEQADVYRLMAIVVDLTPELPERVAEILIDRLEEPADFDPDGTFSREFLLHLDYQNLASEGRAARLHGLPALLAILDQGPGSPEHAAFMDQMRRPSDTAGCRRLTRSAGTSWMTRSGRTRRRTTDKLRLSVFLAGLLAARGALLFRLRPE